MAKSEVELINAVCYHKDFDAVFSAGVDKMFITHREVWKHVVDFYQRYRSVPTIDVLKEKFPDLYETRIDSNIEYYIDKLRDDFIENQMKQVINTAASNIKQQGPARSLDEIITGLNKLAQSTGVVKDLNITDLDSAVEDYERRKQEIATKGSLGIMTGIAPFDHSYPTGLAGGHFVVVIGWSGFGKTAFSTYLACQAWRNGKRPMIVSLEMSAEEMRDRIYTTLGNGRFAHRNLTRGDIDIDSFQSWGKEKMNKGSDFIVVSSEGFDNVTLNTVQAKVDQYQPDLVILDYLQLFDDVDGGGNETTKVRNISRSSKRLALRNNIPVIGLTQATQDSKTDLDNPPLIEQVAWSRAIQHDSDLAIAAHMPPGTDEMEVIARKNRHGQLFGFYLDVDMERGIWRHHFGDD